MAAIYSNENFPLPTVQELRRLGHDVLTIQETGQAGSALPDDMVLSSAADMGRILVTLNRKHFIRLHQANPKHAGIIVCTFDADFVALARRIDGLVAQQQDLAGQLVRVNRP